MSIDTLTLQSFIEVAETGSFTKAADRVGRSQSAISQQMAKLEALLGKTLITRGKILQLTPDGELFLSYARRIYALHNEALDRFYAPELEGEVCFGVPEDFASVYLSDILAQFARIHPRVRLSIECDLTLNLLSRFRDGAFDLVLVKMNRPEDFPNGLDVLEEPLAWAGNPALAQGDEPVPLILAPKPCVYRAAAMFALDRAGRRWRIALSSPSHAGTLAAVKAGLGLTLLPRPMIPETIPVLAGTILPAPGDIHVSLLKHRQDIPAINSLEEFVFRRLRR